MALVVVVPSEAVPLWSYLKPQTTGHQDGKRMCHEASRRNTDNDLPLEQSISESRLGSAANAAVTAAFGAPQEVSSRRP